MDRDGTSPLSGGLQELRHVDLFGVKGGNSGVVARDFQQVIDEPVETFQVADQ